MLQSTRAVRARRVFTATGAPAIPDGVVIIEGDTIAKVGPAAELANELADIPTEAFPDGTLIPGLIDGHAHITLAGDGRTYEQMASDPDEMMALVAVRNLHRHMRAGVTTIRDNGGRNRVPFVVREAIHRGYLTGPRLLLAGRPLTHSGGHFHWCNGVADGEDQIVALVRALITEGADHIKIMASGGSTAGNYLYYASYTPDEMRCAVRAAHQLGRLTTAHCTCTSSITNALDAGLDCIEHAEFREPPADRRLSHAEVFVYNEGVAERIVASGSFVSYTLPAGGYGKLLALRRAREERALAPAEAARLSDLEYFFEHKLTVFHSLMQLGLTPRLVISTDAGPFGSEFGKMTHVFELAAAGGMKPTEALEATTRIAAEACGVDRIVGTLSHGKCADLVVVDGNPLEDLGAMSSIAAVYIGGERVA